jgi:hypothetical protein
MKNKKWIVRFTHNGVEDTVDMEWPEKPERESAAIRIREKLFTGVQLISTTPRGCAEPTVYQLGDRGVRIVGIEECENLG